MLPAPSLRIVSLLPSATEIVCALGAAENLVGVSHECDFPEPVRGRCVLTSARIAPFASSRDIDLAVRKVITDALSIYSVDEAKLAALEPDLIVTQDLCEVCAVSLDDVRSAVARLAKRESVRIVSLSPTRLENVWDNVEEVARAIGKATAGVALRQQLEQRVADIAARAANARFRPRVVSIEWLEPIMLGGTWMPELIELAGGVPVGVEAGRPAPTISSDDLKALAPDVVLVKPCGFTIPRTLEEQHLIESAIIPALGIQARVFISDGNAFFNRPGPRLVESLEILAACVHPELFPELRQKHATVIQSPT